MNCVSDVESGNESSPAGSIPTGSIPTGWITVMKKPKIMSNREAFQLQRRYDIMGLAAVLTSPVSIGMQRRGWKFSRVVKGTEPPSTEPLTSNEKMLPVGNKWGDSVVFYLPESEN